MVRNSEREEEFLSLFFIWVATMAENYAKFTVTIVASKKLIKYLEVLVLAFMLTYNCSIQWSKV